MQFSNIFITIAATMATFAYASPTPDLPVASLWNGEGITETTVGARDVLEARGGHCSGSAYCSNSQGFKNGCGVAVGRVQSTVTYKNGGDQAGVCDGHCGLFVQGSYKDSAGKKVDCTATGYDLTNAVSQIQAFGCQTCGWVVTGENSACNIKMDYVGSC